MKYVITIELPDNPTGDQQSELSYIVHSVADDIFYNHPDWKRHTLYDAKGNAVGRVVLLTKN